VRDAVHFQILELKDLARGAVAAAQNGANARGKL